VYAAGGFPLLIDTLLPYIKLQSFFLNQTGRFLASGGALMKSCSASEWKSLLKP
jgi:hypothetical protein